MPPIRIRSESPSLGRFPVGQVSQLAESQRQVGKLAPHSGEAVVILVIMGVSGSGKSTVSKLLARELGWTFIEGDDYHPAANIDKMRHGIPLDDNDRRP